MGSQSVIPVAPACKVRGQPLNFRISADFRRSFKTCTALDTFSSITKAIPVTPVRDLAKRVKPFKLGQIVATPGVLAVCACAPFNPSGWGGRPPLDVYYQAALGSGLAPDPATSFSLPGMAPPSTHFN